MTKLHRKIRVSYSILVARDRSALRGTIRTFSIRISAGLFSNFGLISQWLFAPGAVISLSAAVPARSMPARPAAKLVKTIRSNVDHYLGEMSRVSLYQFRAALLRWRPATARKLVNRDENKRSYANLASM
jgi:hypothetical protein